MIHETTSPPGRAAAISRERMYKPKENRRHSSLAITASPDRIFTCLVGDLTTLPRLLVLNRGPDFAKEDGAGITMMKTMLTAWPQLQDLCHRILTLSYETQPYGSFMWM